MNCVTLLISKPDQNEPLHIFLSEQCSGFSG